MESSETEIFKKIFDALILYKPAIMLNKRKREREEVMFGCHKCGHNVKTGTAFEESPCAKCQAALNPPVISRYEADPATFNSLNVMHPAYDEGYDKDDVTQNVLSALGQTVRTLVKMKEKFPETYKFVDAKMNEPSLSYTDLAVRFSCRKQNVLYHFKKAVSICPELSCAIIVDSRFSAGRHALRNGRNASAHQLKKATDSGAMTGKVL